MKVFNVSRGFSLSPFSSLLPFVTSHHFDTFRFTFPLFISLLSLSSFHFSLVLLSLPFNFDSYHFYPSHRISYCITSHITSILLISLLISLRPLLISLQPSHNISHITPTPSHITSYLTSTPSHITSTPSHMISHQFETLPTFVLSCLVM